MVRAAAVAFLLRPHHHRIPAVAPSASSGLVRPLVSSTIRLMATGGGADGEASAQQQQAMLLALAAKQELENDQAVEGGSGSSPPSPSAAAAAAAAATADAPPAQPLTDKEIRKLAKKAMKAHKRARRAGEIMNLKPCDLCKRDRDLLVRCQIDDTERWFMVCGLCWRDVSGGVVDGDAAHPHYRYGGLWKAH